MFARSKNLFFYATAAAVFFTLGLACNKMTGGSVVSNDQVVATVGDHKVTFGDWMKQLDVLRVFTGSVDPDSAEQSRAVLDSLIDQCLILDAAQKAHYSDPKFDESLKLKLQEADVKLKDLKDKLEKDIQTVHRIEKDYQDPYKKMLLANEFAKHQVGDVVVTNKDLKDWYADYGKHLGAGGNLPPFEKVQARIKPAVQADKFIKNLESGSKIDRNTDVINKYLQSLSASQQMLGSSTESGVGAGLAGSKDAGKK